MTDLRDAREAVLLLLPAGTVFSVNVSAWSFGPICWEIFIAKPLGQRSRWYRAPTFEAAFKKLQADMARRAA